MGDYPFKLDQARLQTIIASVPLETRRQLGYADRAPTREEQQTIIDCIADQVIFDDSFRRAVAMRLIDNKKVTANGDTTRST